MAPVLSVLRMMLANCSGVCSRDCAVTVALSICSLGIGCPPISPAAISVFWFWIAVTTSLGISEKLASRSGFSQIRIAYCDPNTCVSPTPGTRASGSWRFEASQSDTSWLVILSVES